MPDGRLAVEQSPRCLRSAGDGDGVSERTEEAGVFGGVRSVLGIGGSDGVLDFLRIPFRGVGGVIVMSIAYLLCICNWTAREKTRLLTTNVHSTMGVCRAITDVPSETCGVPTWSQVQWQPCRC